MSRSYKKNPWCCSSNHAFGKNQANRRIRNVNVDEQIPNGKYYKRYYNSWEICEYKNYTSFSDWCKSAIGAIAEDICKGYAIYGYRSSMDYWEKCFKRK